MNRICSVAASAVVILWSVGAVNAAPKQKDESRVAEARTTFKQIDGLSARISDVAFKLGELAKREQDSETQLEGLADLRADVNQIGADLRALEKERASLSPWEVKALDETARLMSDVAGKTARVIDTFNSDRNHLWATSYADDTSTIGKDADTVKTLLRDYLTLAGAREKEQRLEQILGTSGF